jgi:hypothetical protein
VILKIEKKDFIDTWPDAVSALEQAVEYFRNRFGIPVYELLPYNALLVLFSYYFFITETNPNAEQRKFLEEFFGEYH